MQRAIIGTHEFRGSKGPHMVWLLLIGAAIVVSLFSVLMLATKLRSLPKDIFEKALLFGAIIAFIVAIIMRIVRDWRFIATYCGTVVVSLLLALLANSIAKSLPLAQEKFMNASRILAGIYIVYVIAMIILKIVTRGRIVISDNGELCAYSGSTKSCHIKLSEYENRIELTYSRMNIYSEGKGNKVDNWIEISIYSHSQHNKIRKLVEQFAGEFVSTIYQQINDNSFFPEGWQERIKVDADFRDEMYKLIIETHSWADHSHLRDAMEAIAALGQVKAMYAIGMYYFDDKTIKTDYKEGPKIDGLNWLRTAAKHGSTKAAYELGEYYDTHWNKGYSPSAAIDYYKQAMNDPELKRLAELGLNVARGRDQQERQARGSSYTPSGGAGTTRTKAEVGLDIALTAINYAAQAEIIANNDNLTDEQKAKGLGMLAGLEFNEQRELHKERKDAGND